MVAQEQKQHGEWSEKIKVEKSVCRAVGPTKCSKLAAKMKIQAIIDPGTYWSGIRSNMKKSDLDGFGIIPP